MQISGNIALMLHIIRQIKWELRVRIKAAMSWMLCALLVAIPVHAEPVYKSIKKVAKKDLKTYSKIKKGIKNNQHLCGIGVQGIWQSVITRLSDEGMSNGFKPGDKIIAVNSESLSGKIVSVYFPEHFNAGERLNVSILRDSAALDLEVVCNNDSKRLQAVVNLLQVTVKRQWQKCIDQSHILDSVNGVEVSSTALYRLSCNEGIRCRRSKCKAPTISDAQLAYRYRILALEEALFVENGLQTIQSDVLAAIGWLEQSGFHQLATDLEKRLQLVTE